jgi:hypothetical protein
MMEPAKLREGDNPTEFRRLNRPSLRGVLVQREMRAAAVIVGEVGLDRPTKAGLVEMEEIARHGVPRKRIPELLGSPFGRWMSGDIEVNDAPAIMGQHQEDVEDLETDRRHGEEIHRDQVLEGGSPGTCATSARGASGAAPCTC